MKTPIPMPLPTPPLVFKRLQEWQDNDLLKDQSLELLFNRLFPSNNVLEHVLLKVSVLNDFYSTNIYDTCAIARHIHGKNIDPRLRSGDLSLVNEIARVTIKNKERVFYSFASKYCSHHYPNIFPIYDSYVEKMLLNYARIDSFSAFHAVDLRHYDRFVKIVEKFQSNYGLTQFSFKEIDIFLWLAGKEYFKPTYRRHN